MLTGYFRTVMLLGVVMCLTRCGQHEPSIKDVEGPPSMSSSVENAPLVSWCDLVNAASKYDKVIVRTSAFLHADRENEFLYRPECHGTDGAVWVEFDPSYSNSDEALRKRLTELIRPKLAAPAGMARVTVVGRFDSSGGPYGHLEGYRFRFSIMRLEQAEESEATIY